MSHLKGGIGKEYYMDLPAKIKNSQRLKLERLIASSNSSRTIIDRENNKTQLVHNK